ncbi:MAG: branched-chain amino acid ABC transporter permease [Alcaligenaceae bacterium]|jgi:branched-chain amino acid transport system permease protein|nr:branched-chain amino acid ABC transporter permease [Alcaligenaceae bacterium]HZJ97098.1 branched-chain amino acid ABC transporter permease [Oligella sp.]
MNTIYLIVFSIAFLILISLGLAIIFGMMKVINLAHGEFMMLGGFFCVICHESGVPFILSVLLAGLAVGVLGIIIERLIIRQLYGRLMDTLLATWGLSLLLVGGVTYLFGASGRGVSLDYGNVSLFGVSMAGYNLFIIAATIVLVLFSLLLVTKTKYGVLIRGTMQNPDAASSLGASRSTIYMVTFGYGSFIAGLAGAILAPLTGVSPTMGSFFVAKSFITVISGGQLPLLGATLASTLYGFVDGLVSYNWSSILGEIAMLFVAVIVLRIMPKGITNSFKKGV